MIKIHNKLWYIVNSKREENLAYMTHYENNKAFEKRKITGEEWATRKDKGIIIDNTPVSGMYIGDSVSRYTTSNKLFRVTDPRGFMVEVPTGNIATLLHLITVKNGIVQEKCAWGRDGNNHILLPVNSEPYKESIRKMDILQNHLLTWKDIKAGDWVKLFEEDTEYYYAGKAKFTWNIKGYTFLRGRHYLSSPSDGKLILDTDVKDNKWVHVLLQKHSSNYDNRSFSFLSTVKPKIEKILHHKKIKVFPTDISSYPPKRIIHPSDGISYLDNYRYNIIDAEWK